MDFDVPLFACNPPGALRNGWRDDLFQVVNFGRDPENGFKALRAVQPAGPNWGQATIFFPRVRGTLMGSCW